MSKVEGIGHVFPEQQLQGSERGYGVKKRQQRKKRREEDEQPPFYMPT